MKLFPLQGSFLRYSEAISLAPARAIEKNHMKWLERELGSAVRTQHGAPTIFPRPKPCPVSGLGLSPQITVVLPFPRAGCGELTPPALGFTTHCGNELRIPLLPCNSSGNENSLHK